MLLEPLHGLQEGILFGVHGDAIVRVRSDREANGEREQTDRALTRR